MSKKSPDPCVNIPLSAPRSYGERLRHHAARLGKSSAWLLRPYLAACLADLDEEEALTEEPTP